jgi:uroporphyrinogen decarboxylase
MPNSTMTSRQRVQLAINHRQPDRVPFDLALTADIYDSLRRYLNLSPDSDRSLGYWTEVTPSMDLLDAMQVDFYTSGLNKPANPRSHQRNDGLYYDEWGIGRRRVERPNGGYYFEMVYHPLANASLQDILDYPWPDPQDPGRVNGLRERILRVHNETDKAIVMKFSNSIWEMSWWLRGLEQWMIDLTEHPDIVAAILEHVTETAIGLSKVGIQAVGDLVDILRLSGEDLGTQLNPMISTRMYQQIVRPYFERFWRAAKSDLLQKNPAGKTMLHSCGSVRAFIPDWIDMGLDILDPIQPRARGMEPDGLKRDFGERLVFHGGIDIQHTLPFGTPQEVMLEVQRYIRALAPGGGYIVAPAHNVQGDVPPQNLVALRDAVLEYGWYPIA